MITQKDTPSRVKNISKMFLANKVGLLGLILVAAMVVFTVIGPFFVRHAPNDVNPMNRLKPPSQENLLGTDQFGRDLMARIVYGAKISLYVGILSVGLSLLIGGLVGAIAGFCSRWMDEVLMRAVDVLMSFPYIVLAIGFLAIFGPGLENLVIVIGITRAPGFARLLRASVLSLKEREFIEAARATGNSGLRLLFRHILPNCMAPLMVLATLNVATAINMEAALSFLGLGIRPPDASWGVLVADGRSYLFDAPWMAITPGIAISLTVLGFNLLGDFIRDWIDVKIRD
jgi:peptide/nickel transport system permease protein